MKGKNKFGFVEPTVIMSVIVALIMLGAGVFAVFSVISATNDNIDNTTSETTVYRETFQLPDVNNSDPTEDWYLYSSSGLDYINVTNLSGSDLPSVSNQSFLMYTETDGVGGALFDVNDSTYSYLQIDVKVDASRHNHSIITIGTWIDNEFYTGHGAFAFWNISNTTIEFHVITIADGNLTTEVWNQTILNNTWYRLRATFNYNTYSVASTIWNEWGIAGVPIQLATGSAISVIPFTNITQSFWAVPALLGDNSCYIYHDDFELSDTVTESDYEIPDIGATANSVFAIIGVVLIIGSIMAIVGTVYKYVQ